MGSPIMRLYPILPQTKGVYEMKYTILILAAFLLSNCALKDVVDIVNNSGDAGLPKYDMDFAVPVLERTENMSDYLTIPSIVKADITIPDFPATWPAPAGFVTVDPTETSQPITIDFDGDSVSDFTLTDINSTGSGYLELRFSIKFDGTAVALDSGDLSIGNIIIEGTTYHFGAPYREGNNLVFRTTDLFTAPNLDISPTTTAPVDQINLDLGAITLNPGSKAAGATAGTVSIGIGTSFYFGTVFSVSGTTSPTEKKLYSISNQEIPLTDAQGVIKKFNVELDIKNTLPFALNIKNGTFTADDGTIIYLENRGNTTIEIPYGTGSLDLSTSDNIFDKGKMKFGMDIYLPASATITISNNMSMFVKLSISGSGTFNLNKLF